MEKDYSEDSSPDPKHLPLLDTTLESRDFLEHPTSISNYSLTPIDAIPKLTQLWTDHPLNPSEPGQAFGRHNYPYQETSSSEEVHRWSHLL